MKKISKVLISALTAISVVSLAACGDGQSAGVAPTAAKSTLIGTFTYQEVIGAGGELLVTHDPSNIQPGSRSLMASTVYPLDTGMDWSRISYNMDQRLKLKRDYTYEYDYTVIFGNPGDWGAACFAQITVNMTGVYTFDKIAEDLYFVTLSDPTGGSQAVRSFSVVGAGVYGLSVHNEDDLYLDYSYLSGVSGYKFDEYSRGRTVTVDKSEDTAKQLDDDVFYPDLFDYMTKYATY